MSKKKGKIIEKDTRTAPKPNRNKPNPPGKPKEKDKE